MKGGLGKSAELTEDRATGRGLGVMLRDGSMICGGGREAEA